MKNETSVNVELREAVLHIDAAADLMQLLGVLMDPRDSGDSILLASGARLALATQLLQVRNSLLLAVEKIDGGITSP